MVFTIPIYSLLIKDMSDKTLQDTNRSFHIFLIFTLFNYITIHCGFVVENGKKAIFMFLIPSLFHQLKIGTFDTQNAS